AELDRAAELEAAIDKGRELGRTVGLEQGLKEGRKEGRLEGEIIGRKKKAIEDATKFKAAGVASDIISQCTGLTLEEVENL
ncbi:MAG: hypothetical protein MJY77_09290, partial [Bacteroidaceae bacterium]|nr:hypothetical protein [Bacteroidaceae bacterium]